MKRFTIPILISLLLPLPISAKQPALEELLLNTNFRFGMNALESENLEDAETAFRNCTKEDKKNFPGWIMLSCTQRLLERDCKEVMKSSLKGYNLIKKSPGNTIYKVLHTDNLLHCEKDTSRVESMLFDLLKDAPADDQGGIYHRLYSISMDRQDTVMAYRYLDNAIAADPTSYLYLKKAESLPMESPRKKEFIDLAVDNANSTQDYLSAIKERILYYIVQNQSTDAIDDVLRYFYYSPEDGLHNALSILELSPEYSISQLRQLCKNSPSEANWASLLSLFSNSRNDNDIALEFALRAFLINGGDFEKQVLANMYMDYGDFEKALSIYELYDDDAEPLYVPRATCLIQLGRFDEAINYLKKGIELDSSDHTQIRFLLGNAFMDSNRFSEAIPYYDTVNKELDYSFIPSLIMQADAYIKTGDISSAKKLYDKALILCTDEESSLDQGLRQVWLPVVLAATGHGEEAESIADSIYQNQEIDDPAALYMAACYYTRIGDTQKGINTLQRALNNGYDFFHAMVDYDLAPLRLLPEFIPIIENARQSFEKKVTGIEEKAYQPL